jgi:hypothetical protein
MDNRVVCPYAHFLFELASRALFGVTRNRDRSYVESFFLLAVDD